MTIGHLAIGLHRQVTAKATGHPGRVAGKAGHILVAMRQLFVVGGHIAPGRIVEAHRFRVARLHAVVLSVDGVRIDGVDGLLHSPPTARDYHGVLNDVPSLERDLIAIFVLLPGVAVNALKQKHAAAVRIAKPNRCQVPHYTLIKLTVFDADPRGKTRRDELGAFAYRPVTVDTSNLNCSAGLGVENAVAVRVLPKMTVDAMHAFFEMNVVEMDGFVKSIRIVGRHNRIFRVEQVPFPIALEHLPENPAMTVRVRELRSLQTGIEFGGAGLIKKLTFRPKAAQTRRFRVAREFPIRLALGWIVLPGGVHLVTISFVVPPNQPHVRRHHVFARMHVADHALRRRNASGQLMLDGMT